MSDQKEYVSCPDEHGNLHISEDVLSVIAAAAAVEVEGVAGLTNQVTDINDLRNPRTVSKGVRIRINEGEITLDVALLVKYGYTIPDVASAVQNAVVSAVESMSGLKCESVNIHVSGISFEKANKKSK